MFPDYVDLNHQSLCCDIVLNSTDMLCKTLDHSNTWCPHLSEKALISQRSSSSSATHVSITTGPVCFAGSGFLGRKALERKPFL